MHNFRYEVTKVKSFLGLAKLVLLSNLSVTKRF